MKYDYVVTLKRDKEKYIDVTSIFLCINSILAFILVQLQQQKFNMFYSFAATILIGGLFINIFILRNKGKILRYKNWLLIAGIFWIGMPYLQWLCVIFFLLAFLEYQAKYPLEIGFSNKIIVVNSLFRKKFEWSDFTNIVLKDGLLTMDFKNNRLVQKQTIDDDVDDGADEDEFNDYCRNQLTPGQ
ncbi:MAG TPA: hypothetical protein VKR53_14115 [Puia sp.]|nr:hypothetical protein [Puia sp.]